MKLSQKLLMDVSSHRTPSLSPLGMSMSSLNVHKLSPTTDEQDQRSSSASTQPPSHSPAIPQIIRKRVRHGTPEELNSPPHNITIVTPY